MLGLVQGAAEFLPISSSGHLVIAQNFLGIKEPSILIETSLHLGTMLAIFVMFKDDLLKIIRSLNFKDTSSEAVTYRHFGLMIIAGSVPAAIFGILFKSKIEQLFDSTLFVGFALLVTGVLLLASKRLYGSKTVGSMSYKDAIFIGVGQALAILPGISRSGSTIVAALFRNVEPKTAASFSLILSIPAILGANVLALTDASTTNIGLLPLALGTLISFVTGVFAIKLLLKVLINRRMELFAAWCFAMGVLIISLETL